MANVQKDLGPVSAYAIAVKHGYQGTEEEWAALQIAAAENAAAAAQSAKAAADTLEAVEETVKQETAQAVQAVKDQETASIESVEVAASAAGAAQEAAIAAKGAETLESIPSEYATLAEQVNQNTTDLLTKAPAIECEASGSLVTVTDAAAQPAVQLVTHIEPVQEGEGDPSPDNVRPISGWDKVSATRAGTNLADDSAFAADTRAVWDGAESAWRFDAAIDNNQPVVYEPNGAAGVITLSYDVMHSGDRSGDASILVVEYTDGTTDTGKSSTAPSNEWRKVVFTSNPDKTVKRVRYGYNYGNAHPGYLKNIVVNTGTTATAYEPYQGQTLTADLPETVYGGTLDWGTGVLTVDRARKQINHTDKLYSFPGEGYIGGQITMSDMKKNNRGNGMCDRLTPATSPANQAKACITFGANDRTIYFLLPSTVVGTTLETLNAYLAENPLTVVYPLEEPYTIQLTPQQLEMLRGTNNLWSDTGDTDLVYMADTKSYIDNKIAAIAAAIVNGSPTA